MMKTALLRRASLLAAVLAGSASLAACGHDTRSVPPPPPATSGRASAPAPVESPPSSASASAKGAPPKAAAPDVTGQWCGARVSAAAKCTGEGVLYLELKTVLGATLAVAGDAIGGQICRGYGRDCAPLDTGSFTGGNTLLLAGALKPAGSNHATPFRGTFTLGADGVLVGTIAAAQRVETKLYRVE